MAPPGPRMDLLDMNLRLRPCQSFSVKDRAVETHAAIVPTVVRFHARNAAKANAHAAGHRRFQRYVARHLPLGSNFLKRHEHGFRTAADQMRQGSMPAQ